MFEFEDERLGKIKIVNITEARANIASIMQDKETSYVITKNNRPVRVIVSFETFRRLQSGGAGRSSRGPEARDSIRGLLQSREQDLKESGSRSVRSVPPSPIHRDVEIHEQVVENAPLQVEGVEDGLTSEMPAEEEIPEIPPSTEPPPSDDYFERFRKLYSISHPPTPRVDSRADPPSIDGGADIFPAPPAEKQEIAPRRPPTERGLRHPVSSEMPSIQDLLKELENEKLSDEVEGDGSINPNKVKDFLHKMSK